MPKTCILILQSYFNIILEFEIIWIIYLIDILVPTKQETHILI